VTRLRRLERLQWAGLFVAPLAWVGQHLIGQAAAQLSCSVANRGWGVSNQAWQVGLLVGSCVLIVGAGAAAVVVLLETRKQSYEDPPPVGRLQMFAIAALVTNFLLLLIVLMDGIGSIVDIQCRQS
jgi:heme/copper-type cytochrome/quinol oxidase subunit 2